MTNFIKFFFINLFNRLTSPAQRPLGGGLLLGRIVGENGVTDQPYYLPTAERAKHISVLGKTGAGKSFFLRHLAQRDVQSGRGFLLFDLHGDLIPAIMRCLAACGTDPERVILIDPTSREWAVGMNPLEATDEITRYLQIVDVTRTLADRWDFKGARTEELLRNSLLVLSENNLTILEVGILLANDSYRAKLLRSVTNADVREYFELRFDPLSDAMKATMREPVLNKLTELTADPHYRFILGQRESTISFDEILNRNLIVLVNLNKGALGMHAPTLGALVYSKFKAAIFRRHNRNIFTVYADEIQNVVSDDTDFDVLFSEARKFGVSVVTANQFAGQLPARMRSAIQAIGTRIFFQLSPEDAEQVAREISGGKGMAEKLKNLPPRHFIAKQGNHKPYEVVTPDVVTAKTPAVELYAASNALHARRRDEIERDILARRPKPSQLKEVLNDWE
jgi:type IV secretory pathway VirB4 component